jgi:hypothetical protein
VLKILFLTSLTTALIFSQPALAQFTPPAAGPTFNPPDGADETLPEARQADVTLENPLPIDTVPELVGRAIKAILGIIGSLALMVFVYGGFVWLTAAGNVERVARGKSTLIWAAIGLAVIFLSYSLIRFILAALTGSR